ncbi:MAG: hypothetical protein GEU76_05580 [Alphaproteobacteria bacterium]|nr:hypothetical protein [Alphaproteobacteria bacterium]
MLTLEQNQLVFRFPEVHPDAVCSIEFQRTLRVPDDGKKYPLPPGLGRFPLRHIDDYATNVPDDWLKRGGVIMPMHQAEAMWIRFHSDYPCAVKVATGKVCAVSGDTWRGHLNRDPQDYVVTPTQPWLDGYCVEKGIIRQFVAMPLGQGYSVEEQLTGMGDVGGVQLLVYPMKRKAYETQRARQEALVQPLASKGMEMGIAPGGQMRQEIYDDPYGLEAWEQRRGIRCFVAVCNSPQWIGITGECPPTEPPTARKYTDMGLPWFDYYDGDSKAIEGAVKLGKISSVVATAKKKEAKALPENDSCEPADVRVIRRRRSDEVREFGIW